jgi:FkbM family methyltransferase
VKISIQKIIKKLIKIVYPNQLLFSAPFNYVQNINEFNVHKYIGCSIYDINNWCIVGGHLAYEIKNIKKNYPQSKITVFECSKRYIKQLQNYWINDNRVTIVNKAVSKKCGVYNFFETSLNGSGSLLKLDKAHIRDYGSQAAEIFKVETITLDEHYKNKALDILQIDVQGAEKFVLEGANKILKKVKAIFIEISLNKGFYKGASTFDNLYKLLTKRGFKIALLGTDFNLTGNALFVRHKL